MGRSEDGEFELILGNKQLLSVFFIVVVLLGVFFTMGYIVGKNSVPPEIARREPIVVDPNAAPNKEPSPEPAAEPKQQPPEERKTPAVETPSRPEPVKPVEKPTEPRPEAKKESPKPPPPVEHPAETPPHPGSPRFPRRANPALASSFSRWSLPPVPIVRLSSTFSSERAFRPSSSPSPMARSTASWSVLSPMPPA